LSQHTHIKQLIDQLLQDDQLAQRQLVDLQGDRLYAICLRYVGDTHTAKDALQESFIRIFKHIKKYDAKKGSFNTWISTITVRQCLSVIDRRKLTSSLYNDKNELLKIVNESRQQEPKIIDKMNADDLMLVVRTLPDGYREVFNLAVIEGYSHKEIGELLGYKESYSRTILTRAKNLLRDKLQGSGIVSLQ